MNKDLSSIDCVEMDYLSEDYVSVVPNALLAKGIVEKETPDYSSNDYCRLYCEFNKVCYANHDGCIKQTLVNVLKTLTHREELIVKLRFGLYDGVARTYEEIGALLNLNCESIASIVEKALKKLRHPSRGKLLKMCLHDALLVSNGNIYLELLMAVFGGLTERERFEARIGIDFSIIDEPKNAHKSVAEIKNELNKNVCEFIELQPFIPHLRKLGITTLNHLLRTSNENLLFVAFEKNDVLYFDLIKALSSLGYIIKDSQNATKFDDMFVKELKRIGMSSAVYEQPLEELPLGISITLFEYGITTIGELLDKMNVIDSIHSLDDDMKQKINDYLVSKKLVSISDGMKIYVDSMFWDSYYKKLVLWMRDNSHSIFSFIDELKTDASIFEVVSSRFPDFGYDDICKDYIPILKENLNDSIEKLGLCVRTVNCLKHAGIDTISDLIALPEKDCVRIRNLGSKGIAEVQKKRRSITIINPSEIE